MEIITCNAVLALSLTVVMVGDWAVADSRMDMDSLNGNRDPKLSVFQVVKFTNSHCIGGSKNGTCFTRQECDNVGGVSDGTCADGFGVCCTVTLTTEGSTSVNNSYISVATSTNLNTGSNLYTICPCSDDICRIKFDFESFDIAGPTSLFNVAGDGSTDALYASYGNAAGQCQIDSFQIISPSGRSSPLICGDNDNQHMILDVTDSECLQVDLSIGQTTATVSRELDIRIIQYRCGDEQGGPAGCLQYFENTSGKIRSFNFPDGTPGTTISGGYAMHLASQHYTACIRRGNGKEVICYAPCTFDVGESSGTSVTAQPSFGLSITSAAIAMGQVETACSTDYIWIPNGIKYDQFTDAIAIQDDPLESDEGEEANVNRFCGRYFQTAGAAGASIEPSSICSYVTPFVLGVDFDSVEVCSEAESETPNECEGVHEDEADATGASGSLGFSLCYVQHTPPV